MIRMIVMDLDGTLLRSDKTISPYTLSVLQKVKSAGIKIAIATARSEKSARSIIDLTEPDVMIVNGGALGLNKNGEILYKKFLSVETSDSLINDCLNHKAVGDITVETSRGYYVSYKEEAEHPGYIYGQYYDFSKPLSQETYKIMVETPLNETAVKIGSKYHECSVVSFTGENWHMLAHREAAKMSALKTIAAEEDISMDEIIAFGDDYNDMEMVIHCGVGIAMENGIKEIKRAANHICKSNDEDGVGRWLQENIL